MQSGAAAAGDFERLVNVRALGNRRVPAEVAHGYSPTGVELLVIEAIAPSLGIDSVQLANVETDARKLLAVRHPNLACVRDIRHESGTLFVATEFAEGETLDELRKDAKDPLPLEIGLRILVDILSAMSALHGAGLVHGEVSAFSVLVGYDGTTRLLRPYRGRAALALVEEDATGYMAPEILKGEGADFRADIFSAGVLLWEILSRRKLFQKPTRDTVIARSALIPKAQPPPEATWAQALVQVAEKALGVDPKSRYGTAAEMAAAVRLIVRSKLAMPPKVAAFVDKVAGEQILARRAKHTTQGGPELTPHKSVRPMVPPATAKALDKIRPSSRPPPPAAAAPVVEVPKAPALPKVEPDPPKPEALTLDLEPAKVESPKPTPIKTEPKKIEPWKPRPKAESVPKIEAAPVAVVAKPAEPPNVAVAPIAAVAPVAPAPVARVEPRPPPPKAKALAIPLGVRKPAAPELTLSAPPDTPSSDRMSADIIVESIPPISIEPEPISLTSSAIEEQAPPPLVKEPPAPPPAPKPAAKVEPEPVDPVAVEVSEPEPVAATPVAASANTRQRGKMILALIGVVCVVVLGVAVIRMRSTTTDTTPTATTTTPPASTTHTTATQTTTSEPIPTPTETTAPPASTSAAPVESGSASIPTARPSTTRPRSTYDPQGI